MSKLKVNNIEPLSGSVVTVQGDVNLEGTLTAREVRSELTESIILYQSGSTKLGDSLDDLHQITGSLVTSGNVNFSNDLTVDGYTIFKNDQFLTGSLFVSGARVEFDANNVRLGANFLDTQNILLGNPSASLEVRSSDYTHFGNIKLSGSIDSTYPSNKLRSFYPGVSDLPDPSVYHGMFAHVHETGKAYYSHQGGWVVLAESESVASDITALSSSTATAIGTEKGRIDAILSASSADTDTFAEIVELINSVDTENDTVFAGYVTSSTTRLDNIDLEIASLTSTTSSYAIEADLNLVTASVNSLIAETGSYALQTELNTVTASLNDLVEATGSYALQTELNTVTASLNDLVEATGSYALSSSLESEYLSIAELKAIVTGSADFNEFKTAILAL